MNEKIYTNTFIIMWPVVILVSIILFLVFDQDTAYSFGLGAIASMLAMSYHYKSITNAMKNNIGKVQFVSNLNFILRYIFYIIILGIAFLKEDFDIIYVFLGLISFKFVLFFNVLLSRKVGDE